MDENKFKWFFGGAMLVWLVFVAAIVAVAYHFISKYW